MEYLFLILLLPFFIYWCINEKTGLQLGIIALISIWGVLIYRYIYLPADIDFRWIFTALVFCGFIFLRKKMEKILLAGGFRAGMTASAVFSFLMLLYLPGNELLIPSGAVLGLGTGYCINKRFIGFKSGNAFMRTGYKKILTLFFRLLIGLIILFPLYFSAAYLIPQDSANYNLFGFLHAALCGFWVSAASPWIFIKLRLAEADKNNNDR